MSNNEAKRALAEAIAHHQAGRLEQAEPLYRAALSRQSRNPDALHFLGVLLHHTGRLEEARDLMQKSIELAPAAPHYYANFAELLRAMNDSVGALVNARKAAMLNPNDADAHHSLAMALRDSGDAAGAIAEFNHALRLRPNHPAAMAFLGSMLLAMGKLDESITVLRRAVTLAPNDLSTLLHLGTSLQFKGRFDEAAETFRKALSIDPKYADAQANLGNTVLEMGEIDQAIAAFDRAIELNPALDQTASNRIMALNYRDDFVPAGERASARGNESSQSLFQAHVDWAKTFTNEIAAQRPTILNNIANKRLRIGYVSADFRFHSVALFLEPLIESHDAAQVEVFCYSNVLAADAMTGQFQKIAHHWREITALTDERAADLIRQDEIDILIDLAGHTNGNRLKLFALRPAPLQVAYLGWQHTTGLTSIDARITDALVDPPGMTEAFHTESLVRLPRTFAVYKPRPDSPDVSELPALKNGYVTFGSVSKIAKISPQTLDIWSAALHAVGGAKLVMIATGLQTASLRARILAQFELRGVSPDRIELLPDATFADYMKLHSRFDILLDTVPFNGHTTTCHGLWMGVPTLTLAGQRYASRMGLSVNTNLGLEQFIANSSEEFAQRAAEISADMNALANLRIGLRDRVRSSVLMDYRGFAHDFENALRGLWSRATLT